MVAPRPHRGTAAAMRTVSFTQLLGTRIVDDRLSENDGPRLAKLAIVLNVFDVVTVTVITRLPLEGQAVAGGNEQLFAGVVAEKVPPFVAH